MSSSTAPPPHLSPITPSLPTTSTQSPAPAPAPSTSTSTSPRPPPTSTDAATLSSARAALEATILSTGTQHTHPISSRARALHLAAAALASQQAALLKSTAALARDTDRLGALAALGQRRMKELGALDSWAGVLEGDLRAVEETLRIVEGGAEEVCEGCGGELGGVSPAEVGWCGGCEGLWHWGCAGEGEGEDRDDEEWRCRECALREDLEAMVDELGGFVDEEMDASGEILAESAVSQRDDGERLREGKGKGRAVGYAQDADLREQEDGRVQDAVPNPEIGALVELLQDSEDGQDETTKEGKTYDDEYWDRMERIATALTHGGPAVAEEEKERGESEDAENSEANIEAAKEGILEDAKTDNGKGRGKESEAELEGPLLEQRAAPV